MAPQPPLDTRRQPGDAPDRIQIGGFPLSSVGEIVYVPMTAHFIGGSVTGDGRSAWLTLTTGLPPGVLQVATGSGPELGEPPIEHCYFLMFTGAPRSGGSSLPRWPRGSRTTRWNSAEGTILILATPTSPGHTRGCRPAFANTGQLCISMERMYVDAAVRDKFVPRSPRTRSLRLGHSLAYKADIGSLISAKQLDTVVHLVRDAVTKALRCWPVPGAARHGPYFYEPTVFRHIA